MTDTAMGLLREALLQVGSPSVCGNSHGTEVELYACSICGLTARITTLLDSGGWLPIETAPKDRKIPVLITGGTFHWEGSRSSESAPMNHREIAHYNGDVYDDGGEAFYWYRPTHWQPLPPLPKG